MNARFNAKTSSDKRNKGGDSCKLLRTNKLSNLVHEDKVVYDITESKVL